MKEIKITKAEKILNFIAESDYGRTMGEIIVFVIKQNSKGSKGSKEKEYKNINGLYSSKISKLLLSFCIYEMMIVNHKPIWVYKVVHDIAPPFYPSKGLLNNPKKLMEIRRKNRMKRKFDAIELFK